MRCFCNGKFIWKIENYTQSYNNAISGVQPFLYSPPFYTSLFGYKLCLRINLNGVGKGEGKHVALFVHMMQGDYDDTLDWPFTGKFTLSILDQSDNNESRCHLRKTLEPELEPNIQAFQRPTAPYNKVGYGYIDFASVEQMREPQYVKNNTLLVKFKING